MVKDRFNPFGEQNKKNMKDYWISEEEKKMWQEWENEIALISMFEVMFEDRELPPDENVKLAWVFIDGQRKMIGVDNKTLEGFELKDDVPIWKLPLVPIKYDRFERWCTGFDV